MKETTKTGKNQKLNRKLREESVEAIETIRFSLKSWSMIHWTFSLSQKQLPISGQYDKRKALYNTKIPNKFLKKI